MKNFLKAVGLASVMVVSRLIPHVANFAPIGALALFSGVFLKSYRVALIVTWSALFLSDYFLGFHSTMAFVYGSFLLSILWGGYIEKNSSLVRLLGVSLGNSLTFFMITNFGSWLCSGLYEHSWSGLLRAYLLAIPFYRGISSAQIGSFLGATLMSDMFYSLVMFVLYGLVTRRFYKSLQTSC